MKNQTSGKILIADDNPEDLKLMSTILGDSNYDIRVARDGYEALESIQADTPDLIILDVRIPRMDGYELCRRLKKDERYKDVPIVFICALNESFNRVKGFQSGAADYIVKPFEIEEIKVRVKTHIEHYMYQRELKDLHQELEYRVEERSTDLEGTRAYMEALINSIPDLFCIRDTHFGLVMWNKAFEGNLNAIFNKKPHVGMNTLNELKLKNSDFYEQSRQWLNRSYSGEIVVEEFSYTMPGGEIRFFETTLTPIWQDGQIIGVAEVTHDITVRRLAAQNIKKHEALLRGFIDGSGDAICIRDIERRLILWNQGFANGLKTSFGVDVKAGMRAEDYIPAEIFARFQEQRNNLYVAFEGKSTQAEYHFAGIDGEILYFDVRWTPVFLDGEIFGIAEVTRDITERKHREAELQRHREELAHVSRLTTMGELTASMAHELNQPLTAILSNAQAARRFLEHDTVDIEEVKEILDDIIGDDRRADQVIKRLRAFLKRGEFYLKTWDINEVIQEVVRLVHSDAVIRNVSVHLDLLEELPHVLGDRIQIQQVLLNLIINGLDAMKEVHPELCNLIIKAEYEIDNNVKISVKDSGTGIQPDQMQLIFEPFHTTKADGMGMGLSINRSIIQAHQGELWAENNLNQGATFFFTLPIASEDNIDGE